jgi:hypothetical protein
MQEHEMKTSDLDKVPKIQMRKKELDLILEGDLNTVLIS